MINPTLYNCPCFSFFRIVNRKWFAGNFYMRRTSLFALQKAFDRDKPSSTSSLIIHVMWDDMPILLLLFSHIFFSLFTQLLREAKEKYFCHIQHSWLCSSYWHFHTHAAFGAWGILFFYFFLFLSSHFLLINDDNEKRGLLFDVQISDVSAITHRVKNGQFSSFYREIEKEEVRCLAESHRSRYPTGLSISSTPRFLGMSFMAQRGNLHEEKFIFTIYCWNSVVIDALLSAKHLTGT